MNNRVKDFLKGQDEGALRMKAFFMSSLELAAEISKRSAEGKPVTPAEDKFVRSVIDVSLTVLSRAGKS